MTANNPFKRHQRSTPSENTQLTTTLHPLEALGERKEKNTESESLENAE